MTDETLRIADLFCGCGGLSLGFEQAGLKIQIGFDKWDKAVENYKNNFSHPCICMDLEDTEEVEKKLTEYNINFIIGGPPCQDFSHAGKRVEAQRASLTETFAQLIANALPIGFLMENVDRASKSKSYAKAREIYHKAGYGLTEVVLDASKCGVPQKRKRFFVFGLLGAEDEFYFGKFLEGQTAKSMTLRDYFGDSLGFEYYYRHPRNYNRRGIFSIDEPAPTIRGVNRPVPKGYIGHPNDPVSPDKVRALTTLERAKFQTFPDSYKWTGNKTDLEQMIGNAVPVELAEFVAQKIKEYFYGK